MPDDAHTAIYVDAQRRIEAQLAELTQAVTTLVRVEERQAQQQRRLDVLEANDAQQAKATSELKAELSAWVNRGIGLWGAVMALWAFLNSPAIRQLIGS